eukprot:TRINITY_DN3134_c1_g1_i1.p1 TRINITY_DN3134_c1_g1~~TRINITY_DN3134_c1_g1_i1.p1  ORF type:complete len:1120 (+),score=377.58 TRINITY_DN3134_c1_g1_i1:267-3362(+)
MPSNFPTTNTTDSIEDDLERLAALAGAGVSPERLDAARGSLGELVPGRDPGASEGSFVSDPARLGGVAVVGLPVAKDLDKIKIEPSTAPGERTKSPADWLVKQWLNLDYTRQRSQMQVVLDAQNSLLPTVTLHGAVAARHRALAAAAAAAARTRVAPRRRRRSAPAGRPSAAALANAAPLSVEGLALHPAAEGPAVLPEDRLGRELEDERLRDAHQRLKHELYSNRLRGRRKIDQFSERGRGYTTQASDWKSEFRFFYEGDDLRFLWRRPMWHTLADERKGKASQIGQDLDADRGRALARFIRRVSQLGAPETVADVHRLLAEQRALALDLDQETAAPDAARQQARGRRAGAMARRDEPWANRLRSLIKRTVPLEDRVTERRRQARRRQTQSLFPDEVADEAAADVAAARQGLLREQESLRHGAFHDDRLDRLQEPRTPLQRLPDHRRPTKWLDLFAAPGALEDPRMRNPFCAARDPRTPTPEEERGRAVTAWELCPPSAMPSWHRTVAAKISEPFDYARATSRIFSGLQEKAVSDWRPSRPEWMRVFEDSVKGRGLFAKRPIAFWCRERPDTRLTVEWDDIIGARYVDDVPKRGVDRIQFYEGRARWEKRKELAIRWGLDPKRGETVAERNERRKELDRRVREVIAVGDNILSASWGENPVGKTIPPYVGSDASARAGFKDRWYPAPLRDPRALIRSHVLSRPSTQTVLTAEEKEEQEFRERWLADDYAEWNMREKDPRLGYLRTAGFRPDGEPERPLSYLQVQDCMWELRVYSGAPEPGPRERTWLEDKSFINLTEGRWWEKHDRRERERVDAQLHPEYRSGTDGGGEADKVNLSGYQAAAVSSSSDLLGWKTPQEVDAFRPDLDGAKEGYELPRELTYPVESVNRFDTFRWLCKTPWDRIAAKDLTTKLLNPEDDGRYQDLGPGYYFHRNRIFYRRMPVQRLRAYGAELREAKELSERIVPQEMVRSIKNYYAVARHSQVPYFNTKHVTRNGPKFVHTPKIAFDAKGLADDTEDYIRVNPHLAKWANM